MPTKNILVVGGAGYIGSHMTRCLREANYTPIVLDNLSTGHKEHVTGEFIHGCMQDEDLLAEIFAKYSIDAVMHFAAYIQVNESVCDPEKYYVNNVAGTLRLLNAMRKANVNKIVLSSTAAVYGTPANDLIDEDHPLTPISPYGRTKLMIETIMQDYARAYDFHFAALRYFNAASADPESGLQERHSPETHLIPLLLAAANNESESITIFGNDYPTYDGTCVRDFIHVNDLCEAHLLALQKLNENKVLICNLGSGVGHSVLDVIKTVEKVTRAKIKINYADRRAGDPATLVADISKAFNLLNWRPKRSDIVTIIQDAWAAKIKAGLLIF